MFPPRQLFWLILASSAIAAYPHPTTAQLIPDDTLGTENSVVTPQQLRDLIEGGAIRGDNLFHSFSEFNINPGQNVYFANPNGIANIFTRVTGVNPSNIFGTLGVDGAANLILLNPNGINFGANSFLDVSGSFFATTAESIIFSDGTEFSAVNPNEPPLLQINITPGVQLGHNPQSEITTAGTLAVGAGQSFSLLATDIIGTGAFSAPEGDITLQATGSINLTNGVVDTSSNAGAGDINLTADNAISLTNSQLASNSLGIGDTGTISLQGGQTISLDNSLIGTLVAETAEGNAGEINIAADVISLTNQSRLSNTNRGVGDVGVISLNGNQQVVIDNSSVVSNSTQGAAGFIDILATDSVSITNSRVGASSLGFSDFELFGESGAIDIIATTGSIDLNQANLTTNALGTGIAGNIFLAAGDEITSIDSTLQSDAPQGIAGFIEIGATNSISLENNLVTAQSQGFGDNLGDLPGSGDGGALEIISSNGSVNLTATTLSTDAIGEGNAGDIILNAGANVSASDSSIKSDANQGLAGLIDVLAGTSVSIIDSEVTAESFGFDFTGLGSFGDGGALDIIAIDGSIDIQGSRFSTTAEGAGFAGNIFLNAGDAIAVNQSFLESSALQGVAGIIELIATNDVSLSDSPIIAQTSGLNSFDDSADFVAEIELQGGSVNLSNTRINANTMGSGEAGNVVLQANDEGAISVSNSNIESKSLIGSTGDAGNISLLAGQINIENQSSLSTVTEGESNAGSVEIATDSLQVLNGSEIISNTVGIGDAGRIFIDATGKVRFAGVSANNRSSLAASDVQTGAVGDAGGIIINAGSVEVFDGAKISTSTVGEGNAGIVSINATDNIILSGTNPDGFFSGLVSEVKAGAVGDAGGVDITANSVEVSDGAVISTSTFGEGHAGTVEINATDSVLFQGINDTQITTAAVSEVKEGAVGDAGGIDINTGSLTLTNTALLSTTTFGDGDAGKVQITASDTVTLAQSSRITSEVQELGVGDAGGVEINAGALVVNGSTLSASTSNQGDAGSVTIIARDSVNFDNSNAESVVRGRAVGDAGGIEIIAGSLTLDNNSLLTTDTFGRGNAGSVEINVTGAAIFANNSNAFSQVEAGAVGNAGNIEVEATSLSLEGGSQLSTNTVSIGNSGDVIITVSDSVNFTGISPAGSRGGAFSAVGFGGVGSAGNVEINANSLTISDGAAISVDTAGQGNAGNVEINANASISLDNGEIDSEVETGGVGDGGNIILNAPVISLTNQSDLDGNTEAQGNAGNVFVSASERISFDNSKVSSQVQPEAQGNAGSVTIAAPVISASNNSTISSSTAGIGNAGDVTLDATTDLSITNSNVSSAVEASGTGDAGNVHLIAPSISISDGAQLSSSTAGVGSAGNVTLVAEQEISLDNSSISSAVSATGVGDGGSVDLTAPVITATNQTSLSALSAGVGNAGSMNITSEELTITSNSEATVSSPTGLAGNLIINTYNLFLDNGKLTAETGAGGANINLQVDNFFFLRNESQIFANATGAASGGNINIDARFIIAEPPQGNQGSDISANAEFGSGGLVTIATKGLFGIEFRPLNTSFNDITASSQFGAAGVVEITRPNADPAQSLTALSLDLVDISNLITHSCPADGKTGGSEFIVTGRGGIPSTPNDYFTSNTVITNWVTLGITQESQPKNSQESIPSPAPIIEAQGWMKTSNGNLVLTAQANPINLPIPWLTASSCYGARQKS